jgi:hypothetical protein
MPGVVRPFSLFYFRLAIGSRPNIGTALARASSLSLAGIVVVTFGLWQANGDRLPIQLIFKCEAQCLKSKGPNGQLNRAAHWLPP